MNNVEGFEHVIVTTTRLSSLSPIQLSTDVNWGIKALKSSFAFVDSDGLSVLVLSLEHGDKINTLTRRVRSNSSVPRGGAIREPVRRVL